MRRAAVVAAFSLVLLARPARAGSLRAAHETDWGSAVVFLCFVGFLLPSEIGASLTDRDQQFLFAWSWQVPIPPHDGATSLHRAIGGIDVVPGASAARVRGRLGYRLDLHYVFAGLAGSLDTRGFGWSPEIGVKFLPMPRPRVDLFDFAAHLLVRGDVTPDFATLRAVSVLLGWSFY